MRKSLILVLAAVFLLVLGAFISATILTPYAQSMGATWIQIGVLSGGMYAVRLFIGTSAGRMADRRGTLVVLFIIPFLENRGISLIYTGSIIAIYNIVSGAV